MSVRAYKVKSMDLEENSTFNLWHNNEFCEAVDIDEQLNENGSGLVSFSVGQLKAARDLLDKGEQKQLDKDIAGLDDDDCVEYRCF